MQVTVTETQLLIAAEGDTLAAQNNARGHLFEQFISQLMSFVGYDQPTTEKLNTTSNGVELDVRATHKLTRQPMIAECKAYSSPVAAKEITSFYGKLVSERFDNPTTFGFFVATPGLTRDAREQQQRLEANDPHFRVLTTEGVIKLLREHNIVEPLSTVTRGKPGSDAPLSDEAIVVSQDGLFHAAHELSPSTRLPIRVLVYPGKGDLPVPPRVTDLLRKLSGYTRGLPCIGISSGSAQIVAPATHPDPIIEVNGSTSDFEYQLPAAPRFFVGRNEYISDTRAILVRLTSDPEHRAEVLVLNAQSGWGKSSLALKLAALTESMGGAGLCIDCRTASQPTFVPMALRHVLLKAQQRALLTLPNDASFGSVSSTLATLRSTRFSAPVSVFFDQFENVFSNQPLTREFRDLALGITDIAAPLVLGFGWKTDVVSFTENYPYHLRDDIRSRATVFTLRPFGPDEIGQLLGRLQRESKQKVHPYVRERIREYSQGLPWLFKKLGNHIIREIRAGTTQDQLLAEVLNIQNLFENDIRTLGTPERGALSAIARRAPLSVTEAVDLATGNASVVQTLVNQRLLVSIGEKLDVYWDVFRDYLNQGTVPLQDSYVLRLTPNGVRKLVIHLQSVGGRSTPDDAAKAINTSDISVHNMARELRQLGVLAAQEGILRFADDIMVADDLNGAVQAKAAAALKRHRVYSLLQSFAVDSRVPTATFTEGLPKAYPAVAAKAHTWANYSRAFMYWLQFAGLVTIDKDQLLLGGSDKRQINLLVPGKIRASRTLPAFPRCEPGPVFKLLKDVAEGAVLAAGSRIQRAILEAKYLGLVEENADGLRLTLPGNAVTAATPEERADAVRSAIEQQTAYRVALGLLRTDPGCAPIVIGDAIGKALGLEWSSATAHGVGKRTRSWMRAAGFETRLKTKTAATTGASTGNLPF